MKILRSLVIATAAWSLTASTFAAGDLWVSNFGKAKETAAKEGKDLLIDFTGSDWCGWCIKLRKEVFDLDAFKNAAPKNFVLVEIDFPQDKSKLTKETQEQNAKLQTQFGIQGFPTILLADAQGRPYAQTGYQPGGPEKYLLHLDELRAVKAKRDAEWKKAEGAQGVEKAKYLAAGLKVLSDDLVAQHYSKVVAEITKLDPKDETGVGAVMGFKADLAALQGEIGTLAGKDGAAAARKKTDEFIASHTKLTANQKQVTLLSLLRIYRPPQDNGTVLKLMGEVKALDPATEEGKQAAQIGTRVKEMIDKAAAKTPAK
ncbi:MAG: thioredoxin family protein [Chthoniobacteraceae bacterium]